MSREFFAETTIEICDLLEVKYFELDSQIWKKYQNAFMGTKVLSVNTVKVITALCKVHVPKEISFSYFSVSACDMKML